MTALAQVRKNAPIEEIAPLGPGDAACMDELREVLDKHGKIGRLGVFLLHSHFGLTDDEVMVETTDAENRTLTIRPVNREDAGRLRLVETSWSFMGEHGLGCETYCNDSGDRHLQKHTGQTNTK